MTEIKILIKCSICYEVIDGERHNASPINNGFCCTKCNVKIVIPERLKEVISK